MKYTDITEEGKLKTGAEKMLYNATEMFGPSNPLITAPWRGYKVLKDVYKGDDASAAFRLLAGARGKSLQGVLSKFLRKSDKHAKVLKGSDIGYNILQDRDKKLMHETFSPFIEDKDLISRRTKDLLKTSDIAYTGWEHENPLTTVRQDQTFIPDTQVKFPPILTEPLFKNIKQELPQLKSGT